MKVSVFTLGCKTNLYESQQIVAELMKSGHDAVLGLERADVFVLNTCAITAEAEKKSRQLVARARKLNPDCRVIVVGCASENDAARFSCIPNVTLVKGIAAKTAVAKELEITGTIVAPVPKDYVSEIFAEQERCRAFVKIQDGCDNFCSYCIVPYLRGRSRSRTVADVCKEVQSCAAKEAVLIGIDISQFGKDNGENLAMLIRALTNSRKRIRIGSIEQGAVSDELLDALTKINFCPHFHLSLQSGSDSVLRRMNRHYTTQNYRRTVEKVRRYFPDAAVTTDIIVGFAGETEAEFDETYNFAEQINFADIHVFPYSPRKGTAAYELTDTETALKKERAEKLTKLKENLKQNFAAQRIGRVYDVLAEQEKNGWWEGYTPNYIRVYFKGQAISGETLKIRLNGVYRDGAEGEIAK